MMTHLHLRRFYFPPESIPRLNLRLLLSLPPSQGGAVRGASEHRHHVHPEEGESAGKSGVGGAVSQKSKALQ